MSNMFEFKLPEDIVAQLIRMPETGMGYQVVDFYFANGDVKRSITVINCTVAKFTERVEVDKIVRVGLAKKSKSA